jgi:ABC-type taurine transport system ATPase subunit
VEGIRPALPPDHGEAVIGVRGLSMRYPGSAGGVQALQDINFTVAEGEFMSLVGPSGCGKTTLLKILAGLLSGFEGRATLRGTPIAKPRRDIGVVFQSPVLFPWRSVLGNVRLPGDVQHLDKARMRRQAMELIKLGGSTASSTVIRRCSERWMRWHSRVGQEVAQRADARQRATRDAASTASRNCQHKLARKGASSSNER